MGIHIIPCFWKVFWNYFTEWFSVVLFFGPKYLKKICFFFMKSQTSYVVLSFFSSFLSDRDISKDLFLPLNQAVVEAFSCIFIWLTIFVSLFDRFSKSIYLFLSIPTLLVFQFTSCTDVLISFNSLHSLWYYCTSLQCFLHILYQALHPVPWNLWLEWTCSFVTTLLLGHISSFPTSHLMD